MRKHRVVWIPLGSCIAIFICVVCVFGQTADGIVVDSSGKVGIGTSSPPALLSIGTGPFSPGYEAQPSPPQRLVFDNLYDNSGYTSANKIMLYNIPSWVAGIGVSANDVDFFSGENFRFYVGHNESSQGTEALSILSNGYVGIGTSSPSFDLEVADYGSNWDDVAYVGIYSGWNMPTALVFGSNGQKERWAISSRESWDGNGYPLTIWRYWGEWTRAMTMDYSNGNMGIGTSLPTQKLDVNGNVTADDFITKSAFYFGDALQVLKSVKASDSSPTGDWAKVDHTSAAEIAVISNYNVPIFEAKTTTMCMDEPVTDAPRMMGDKSPIPTKKVCQEVKDLVISGYETRKFEGMSVDKAIAVLIRANQQLLERIEALEAKLNK